MDTMHLATALNSRDYIACLLGVLLYGALHLMRAKNQADLTNKSFNVKAYFSKHWDDFLFSLMAGFSLLYVAPESYIYYMEQYSKRNAEGTTQWFIGISLFLGLFGGLLVEKLYINVIKRVAEKFAGQPVKQGKN